MVSLETTELEGIHWIAVVLTAITGAIHLYMGVIQQGLTPLGISFIVAGLGFAGWIVLLLVDFRRPLLYLGGVAFVGGQIVLFVVMNWPDLFFALGIVDKAVQLVLLAVLVVLYRRET